MATEDMLRDHETRLRSIELAANRMLHVVFGNGDSTLSLLQRTKHLEEWKNAMSAKRYTTIKDVLLVILAVATLISRFI